VFAVADRLDLCTLEGLTEAVENEDPGSGQRIEQIGIFDGTFCPSCNAERRMVLMCLYWEDRWAPVVRNYGAVLEGAGTAGGEPPSRPPISQTRLSSSRTACNATVRSSSSS
jgi:hypothetical protein